MKCSNCSNNSLFEYQITSEVSAFYCEKHLPKFLEARKRAGLLKTTERFVEAKSEAHEILVPQTPVVEESKEESTEEAPKPKKKAAKKKAE